MQDRIIGLVISYQDEDPCLVESLSDDQELELFEHSLNSGHPDPLGVVLELREHQARSDESFGDYLENLLTQGSVPEDIKKKAVDWFRSMMKIEELNRHESEARNVIANFAFRVFQENPKIRDFYLQGSSAQVRVRVFVVPESQQMMPGKRGAA